MEFNNALMGFPMPTMRSFQSKAEALKYAIEFTETVNISEPNTVNYEAAQELFNFICKNVELPDVRPNPADGLVEFAKKYIEKLAKDKRVDL